MADKDDRKPIIGQRYVGGIFRAEPEKKGRRTAKGGRQDGGGDEDGADPRGLEELQAARDFRAVQWSSEVIYLSYLSSYWSRKPSQWPLTKS